MKQTVFIMGCILNAVFFKCSACIVDTSMSWDTEKGNLLLTCKVTNRHFKVEIQKSMPHLKFLCNSNGACYGNAKLTKDMLSNVTIMVLTLEASEIHSGRWYCFHGTGCGEASVNVTINQDTGPKEYCFQLSTFAIMAGYSAAFICFAIYLAVLNACFNMEIIFDIKDLIISSLIGGVPVLVLILVIILPLALCKWHECYKEYGYMAIPSFYLGSLSFHGIIWFKVFKCFILVGCRRNQPTNNSQ